MDELLQDVAEEVVVIPWRVDFAPSGEWLNRALDLFADTLSWVMANPLLRVFAVASVFIVALNLLRLLLRSSTSLSR